MSSDVVFNDPITSQEGAVTMNVSCQKHFVAILYIICAAGIIGYGCTDTKEIRGTDESVYASVNGHDLTESEFRSLIPDEFFDRLTPTHKKEIIQEWINSELLYQEALRIGIEKEPRIAHILEKSRRDLLSAEILSRKMADIGSPDDTELKKYYDENSEFFILQSDEYSVRYALFDTIDDARDFYNKVKKGASFSDLAEEESKDPSARYGGSLGTVNEENVEPAVWNEIVNTHDRLGLRKISNPFSVMDGFGIIIVDEVFKMGTLKPFDLVRDQVLDLFVIEKREEAKKTLLSQLSSQAKIDFFF